MVEVIRTEADGWKVEIQRWPDLGGLLPDRAIELDPAATAVADLLPREEFDDHHMRVAVSAPGDDAPSLVVALGYHLCADALLVPEASRVFIGGGRRMMAYHREAGCWWRDWERAVEVMFWGIARHGGMVLMQSELELAGWSLDGVMRWSTFVEPPWGYGIEADQVHLDVMGRPSVLDLRTGLPVEAQGTRTLRRLLPTRLGGRRSRD